ncbi:glycosyltransferase family 4 protein [Deinococcus marmoris]|uniref:glycosyltransferase family 4 protein n=1 Tax=Deinococcus marmoris TaxID=249408 RepID=UPI0009E0AC1B|nr:glycosyltransferase family 4 protein [Deinococcus marmoris]
MFDYIFILPQISLRPIGGYKIVYEYSKRLSDLGYKIAIIHVRTKRKVVFRRIKINLLLAYNRIVLKEVLPWFPVADGIKFVEMDEDKILLESGITSSCYIATAWDTAAITKSLTELHDAEGLYLIQGYESWSASEEELLATYRSGLKNVAVSKWLKGIVADSGADCEYLPNSIDLNIFYISITPEMRFKYTVLTMFHESTLKGFEDVIKSCEIVRVSHPDTRFCAFGAYEVKGRIPEWMTYFYLPSQEVLRRLYNESAIFVSGSYSEGWGLAPSEAMLCGCALAITDIPGHEDFSKSGQYALLSQPGDWQGMASNISKLLDDDHLRLKLARTGSEFVKQFNWTVALEKFLKITLRDKTNG